jgi:hypothetical protein
MGLGHSRRMGWALAYAWHAGAASGGIRCAARGYDEKASLAQQFERSERRLDGVARRQRPRQIA